MCTCRPPPSSAMGVRDYPVGVRRTLALALNVLQAPRMRLVVPTDMRFAAHDVIGEDGQPPASLFDPTGPDTLHTLTLDCAALWPEDVRDLLIADECYAQKLTRLQFVDHGFEAPEVPTGGLAPGSYLHLEALSLKVLGIDSLANRRLGRFLLHRCHPETLNELRLKLIAHPLKLRKLVEPASDVILQRFLHLKRLVLAVRFDPNGWEGDDEVRGRAGRIILDMGTEQDRSDRKRFAFPDLLRELVSRLPHLERCDLDLSQSPKLRLTQKAVFDHSRLSDLPFELNVLCGVGFLDDETPMFRSYYHYYKKKRNTTVWEVNAEPFVTPAYRETQIDRFADGKGYEMAEWADDWLGVDTI